jgi:hypothetical protein
MLGRSIFLAGVTAAYLTLMMLRKKSKLHSGLNK